MSPALLNFLKAPNSKRDSGVHYIELSPPFQAKINLPSLAAPRGKRRERKREAKEKNSLDQFPLANTITWLPGSSASCWQPSWPPTSRARLPAAPPRLPPEWDRLAGVRASVPPGGRGCWAWHAREAPGPAALQRASATPAGFVSALRPPPCLCSEGPALPGLPSGSFLLHMGAGCVGNRSTGFGVR